jgi:Methyltransferase domain
MGQITNGIRSALNNPIIYNSSQRLLGGSEGCATFVKKFVRPRPDDKVLGIGRGTARIIDCLPGVDYRGFDISPAYIAETRTRCGGAGHFLCKELTPADLDSLPKFDIALAIGILHHLDDEPADKLPGLVHQALKPGDHKGCVF